MDDVEGRAKWRKSAGTGNSTTYMWDTQLGSERDKYTYEVK